MREAVVVVTIVERRRGPPAPHKIARSSRTFVGFALRGLVITWALNGTLYAALLGWLVCTYFCTVPGYDHLPAVRDSLCRAQVAATQ